MSRAWLAGFGTLLKGMGFPKTIPRLDEEAAITPTGHKLSWALISACTWSTFFLQKQWGAAVPRHHLGTCLY